jgi:hypothetical protein
MAKVMAGAAQKVEAIYQVPFLAQATMDELHRPRTQERLRRVGGHPGRDPRAGRRRAGDRPSAGEDPGA